MIPGSPEYAAAVKGVTFVVPASFGEIHVSVFDAPGYEFHMMVGGQPAFVVPHTEDTNTGEAYPMRTETVPYACSEPSYVTLYLTEKSSGASAPANDGRRIGPKSTVSGGLGGLSVTSHNISAAPDAAASYLMMSAGDFGPVAGSRGVRVTNVDVTDLPEGAFTSLVPVTPAPRRAPDDNVKTFIDASNTKITGKSFSRTEGAFKDVPEETLIYLPAGNTAVGKNFIIGGIAEDFELKATRENAFEVDQDFTAARATFDREFTAGDVDNEKVYSVFLPYALSLSDVDGKLFEYAGYDSANESVTMNEVVATTENKGMTTPNKAYFFKPSTTGALKAMIGTQVQKFTGTPAAPDADVEAEGLHGVYEYHKWTSKPDNIYCYSATDKDGIKAGEFAKVGAGTHIKPFRAYLRINATAAPEFLTINWGDGTTSVLPLDKQQLRHDADGWYTITGFRLPSQPTEKGIYIHNNQKIVVK